MKKFWVWIGIAVVVILAVVLIVTQTRKEEKEIKIGVIAALTGDAAIYGVPAVQGIELAAEEINARGGINGKKIKLIIEDSKCNPQFGVNAANKLISKDKVKVIIGGICSSVTMAVAPIANKNKVILFSPQSAAPQIRYAGDFIFRNWPSSDIEGKIAAELAHNKLKLRKAAIVFINNDYGIGVKTSFINEFQKIGGNVVLEEGIDEGTTDFRTILAKIKNSNPEFIYLATYLKEGSKFLIQAKEIGLNISILAPDALCNEELIKLAGKAAEGIIVTTFAYNPESSQENIKRFVNSYKEKFGIIPNNYAAHGYDALMIIAQAISKVGYNAEKIRDYLYQLKDYPGVSGNTSFDEYGDVIKPPRIMIVKQRQFTNFD
jgi:branched-chain amino acid transport system substrate-binding protein